MRLLWFLPLLITGIVLMAACNDDGTEEKLGLTPTSQQPASTATAQQKPTATPSSNADNTVVMVYFLNEDNFAKGKQPFITPVLRQVEGFDIAQEALNELFEGPTSEEQAQGLRFVDSGATGFSDLHVENGIATLRLTGDCNSNGSTFTIAQEIISTLTQFSSIQYVKIMDQDGETEEPDGPANSIPICLEP
jgi:spore germination protein GerM